MVNPAHVIPKERCYACSVELDRATTPSKNNQPPKTGDAMMCFNCGAFSIVMDDGLRRKPTKVEWERLRVDPFITMMQIARSYAVGGKNARNDARGS